MSTTDRFEAPRHLQPATRAWWVSVMDRWELDPHHAMLLTLAGEAFDRGRQARRQVEALGLTVDTRDGGSKLKPCVKIESDCRLQFSRLIRELDLDFEAPVTSKRPPALRSIG